LRSHFGIRVRECNRDRRVRCPKMDRGERGPNAVRTRGPGRGLPCPSPMSVSLVPYRCPSPLSVYARRNPPNLQAEQKARRIESGHRFGWAGFTLVPVAVSHRPDHPRPDPASTPTAAASPSLFPPVYPACTPGPAVISEAHIWL
jgi:hypothetical protein